MGGGRREVEGGGWRVEEERGEEGVWSVFDLPLCAR